jgi:hypothetical protein
MRLRAKQDEAQYALWKQEAEALPWAIIRVSPRKYRVIRKAGWSWGADFGGPTCRWEFADDGPQNYEEAQKFIKLAREGKKS